MTKIMVSHSEVLPTERMTAILKYSLLVSLYKLHLGQNLTHERLIMSLGPNAHFHFVIAMMTYDPKNRMMAYRKMPEVEF